jgi:Tfp pilus assembly protein PilV
MARLRRLHGDAGASLVEVMVATVILGIGVVGLLSALAFLLRASDRHRQQADAGTQLSQAMEIVADPLETPFEPCGSAPAAYQAAAQAKLGPRVTVEMVEVWGAGGWQPCGATPALPLQQVTISASSPDGTDEASMAVVKRGTS